MIQSAARIRFQIVFHHGDGGAGPHQTVEDLEKPGDVLWMQARGRLVEDQQLLGQRAPAQELGQFDTLSFAARERGRGLPQGQVPEPDVAERGQDARGALPLVDGQIRCPVEQRCHLADGELVQVGDGQGAAPDVCPRGQHLFREPLPGTRGAGDPG